jgi:type VI secretion system secreted protein VgrG
MLGSPVLEPVRLSVREGLNSQFEYALRVKMPNAPNLDAGGAAGWDIDSCIGRESTCSTQLDGAGQFHAGVVSASVGHTGAGGRQISVLIMDVAVWGEEGRHVQYTPRPWLHLCARH